MTVRRWKSVAVGARRRHIAAQFLIESAVTGLLAGGYPAIKAGTIEPITALRRAG